MKLSRGLFLPGLLLMALWGLQGTDSARAQATIELENVEAFVDFGEQIIFIATVSTSAPVLDATLVISQEGDQITHVELVTVQPDGRIEFRFDSGQNGVCPFAILKWYYQFTLQAGSTAQSKSFFVRYMDNRFHWRALESGALKVSWYDRDANFGQAALAAARAGLEAIDGLLPIDDTGPIEIFIYASAEDLRSTLVPDGEEWVAGHADPTLGVVMVAVEPGAEQGILMEQRIPHELMHVMLYRRVGVGYRHIPVWLREGMATLVELYPNPDYERVLDQAVTGNRLISLQELCTSFPASASQAFLAYAQSKSFTRYLLDTYGSTELLNLATTFGAGVDCERGPERVFGAPLSKLETDWLASISGQNSLLPALQSIAPYLVLLCLVLIIPLIGIASTFRKKGNHHGRETYVRK